MATPSATPPATASSRLPRNLWVVSGASFLTDVSSEMVLNLVPLFLSAVLGVRTHVIGLIEGVAEATASLVKLGSGRLSDRLGSRKWLAVAGYALSTLAKPFFYLAASWPQVAAVRWMERVGKGVRTAPRDALIADSIDARRRGLAFGIHRAADTAGAFAGLGIALAVVWATQGGALNLDRATFQTLVLLSLVPAGLAVLLLALLARDVPTPGVPAASGTSAPEVPATSGTHHSEVPATSGEAPTSEVPAASGVAPRQAPWRLLGRRFGGFLLIMALFDLGNSSDAFLVLRASERGVSVAGVLALLLAFNLVYALASTPAGMLSDRLGRGRLLVAGWLLYAGVYLGFAAAGAAWQLGPLYALYGLYYGLTYGTARALVADLVPAELRGTAYGLLNATLGLLDLPASLIAGILWQGIGSWTGFGPAAPFLFGAVTALLAALLLARWLRR